jgi:hypothetical protein
MYAHIFVKEKYEAILEIKTGGENNEKGLYSG